MWGLYFFEDFLQVLMVFIHPDNVILFESKISQVDKFFFITWAKLVLVQEIRR